MLIDKEVMMLEAGNLVKDLREKLSSAIMHSGNFDDYGGPSGDAAGRCLRELREGPMQQLNSLVAILDYARALGARHAHEEWRKKLDEKRS